jgi:hypothetical protein
MIELGYRPLQIWLAPEMRAMLHQAAEEEQLPDAAYAKEIITDHLIAGSLEPRQ